MAPSASVADRALVGPERALRLLEPTGAGRALEDQVVAWLPAARGPPVRPTSAPPVGASGEHTDGMGSIAVRPAGPLAGTVTVGGAKNSVLKLMAATILAEGEYELTNVPGIVDVDLMCQLLEAIGVRTERDPSGPRSLRLRSPATLEPVAPPHLVEPDAGVHRGARAAAGPLRPGPALAARRRRLRLPPDRHAPERRSRGSGARFTVTESHIEGVADDGLRGADMALEFPSVGATENLIMAATLAKGTTTLDNAAREPEIVDLCRFLVGMGAQIEGIGSPTVVIHGVPAGDLHGVDHRVVPDRVEAATYLAAVGLAGGEITVREARAEHMEVLLRKLRAMGLRDHAGARRACGRRARPACTRPTWPPCPTRAWPPTTSRSSPPCSRWPTAWGSSPRTCSPAASATSTSWSAWAPTSAPTTTTPSCGACPAWSAPRWRRRTSAPAPRWWWPRWPPMARRSSTALHHVDRGYEDLVGKLRILGADIVRHDDQP